MYPEQSIQPTRIETHLKSNETVVKYYEGGGKVKMLDIYPLIYAYVRPLIKWFLRRFTRLCELQRICYGYEKGAHRKKAIEQSLDLSRTSRIRLLLVALNGSIARRMTSDEFHDEMIPQAVATVLITKKIKPKIHPDFGKLLGPCIESIWSYRRLCVEVNDMRQIAYDNLNEQHEEKLLKLWSLLMPMQTLDGRKSKQWQDIGFQGDDPMTDFRGELLSLYISLFSLEPGEPLSFLKAFCVIFVFLMLSIKQAWASSD